MRNAKKNPISERVIFPGPPDHRPNKTYSWPPWSMVKNVFPQKIVGTPAEEFGHSLRQRQICLHGHPIEQSENITETAL